MKNANEYASDYPRLLRRLPDLIRFELSRRKINGLSVTLVDGNDTVWNQGFGYEDSQKKRPASADTRYPLGSIANLFTGTAVMQLVEQGLIRLDSPIEEYIPEFSVKSRFESGKSITVRTLMTHHSGLPCDNFRQAYHQLRSKKITANAVDYLKEEYSCYPPDTVWAYSNLGSDLLGMIVERVSGLTLHEYFRKHIFAPLHMRDTGCKEELLSSVSDMAGFIIMVLNGGQYAGRTILREESINQMLTLQNQQIELDAGFRMGLCWLLDYSYLDYAGKVAWHDGSTPNGCGLIIVLPEHRLGICLLSNSPLALPQALRSIAETALKLALSTKHCLPAQNLGSLLGEYFSLSRIPLRELANYTGTFATINGLMQVRKFAASLTIEMNHLNLAMTPEADGWFSLRYMLFGRIPFRKLNNLRIRILPSGKGKILQLEQKISRQRFRQSFGLEFSPVDLSQVWEERTGYYFAEEDNLLAEEVHVLIENEVLQIKAKTVAIGPVSFILKPVSDHEAVIQGIGRFSGDTVTFYRDKKGNKLKIFGLTFSEE